MSFFQIIRNCLSHLKLDKLTLGNVEFWIEGEDVIYSIPTYQWNQESLNNDLTEIIFNNGIKIT